MIIEFKEQKGKPFSEMKWNWWNDFKRKKRLKILSELSYLIKSQRGEKKENQIIGNYKCNKIAMLLKTINQQVNYNRMIK